MAPINIFQGDNESDFSTILITFYNFFDYQNPDMCHTKLEVECIFG